MKSRISTRSVLIHARGDIEPVEITLPVRLTRGTDARGEISTNSEVFVAPWISTFGTRSMGEFVAIGNLTVDDCWVAAQLQFQAGKLLLGQMLQLLWYSAREEIRGMERWQLKPRIPHEAQWATGWGWKIYELEKASSLLEGPSYRPDGPHITGGLE